MKRRTFVRTSLGAAGAAVLPLPLFRPLAGGYRPAPQSPPDVEAVTGDGRRVLLRGEDIADLAARLRGRVLLAADDGYEDARRLLNPSFDKRPAIIAQVTGVADTRVAVDFARENGGLLLAVKCGGHSASGKSSCDEGMMIDLSPFRDVYVDPAARRARVTGGSLLGPVDHESMAFDLAVPLGTVSHTGVGGLVTGGGFGRLARRFGLSIDNLTAVDVVTADGNLVRASDVENSDLFWGVRGGGGNFGIVTSFEFRLHPMRRRVVGGRIVFPLSRARDVLTLYGEYAPEAPDELQLDCGLRIPPGGGPGIAMFGVCWSGDEGDVDRVLAPIRRLGEPLDDSIRAWDYVALQKSGDIDDPRAWGSYMKGGFVREIGPELVERMLDGFEGHPSRATGLFFQHAGGAIARVAPSATAFPQRDAVANMLLFIDWRHGDPSEEHIAWGRRYFAGLERFTHGFYVNDVEIDHTQADILENYVQNLDRMVRVKRLYDPTNLFRLNANVDPAA
jgi:FAD/FMN-containing dehydrogenase